MSVQEWRANGQQFSLCKILLPNKNEGLSMWSMMLGIGLSTQGI